MNSLFRINSALALALALPLVALATTRQLDIIAPQEVLAGSPISIPSYICTDATDGEQIGFFHADYSTNGGGSWTPYCYDVNIGKSATRTAYVTAGGAGSQIWIRVRVAFRGGQAGDVDYTGRAIDWNGSWSNWSVPQPTVIAKISVRAAITAPTRSVVINAPVTVQPNTPTTITSVVSTTATDLEQIGFFHADYSVNNGAWVPYCYDVNLGKSAQRSITVISGSAGTTIKIRNRVAFRGGKAGDVDVNGNPISWNGTWSNWGPSPTVSANIGVAGTVIPGGSTD